MEKMRPPRSGKLGASRCSLMPITKGTKKHFTTNFTFRENLDEWTDAEKANKAMMKSAWSQLALTVQGPTLKIVTKVKNLDSKEAWDRLKEEYEPSEIDDVVDLQKDSVIWFYHL
jgi:hypothetical protein